MQLYLLLFPSSFQINPLPLNTFYDFSKRPIKSKNNLFCPYTMQPACVTALKKTPRSYQLQMAPQLELGPYLSLSPLQFWAFFPPGLISFRSSYNYTKFISETSLCLGIHSLLEVIHVLRLGKFFQCLFRKDPRALGRVCNSNGVILQWRNNTVI